jgi:hypothetical protein
MANALQNAGALAEPSNFAPLHTNRIFTGLWTNRSPLRDAATSDYQEHYGMGRQDSIWDGYNSEITPRLTLGRRPGSSIYNANVIPPVKRYYSFNTFTISDEVIRVMADTAATVYDYTNDHAPLALWQKSAAAVGKSTYFLGIGNTLYFTNGVDNKQATYDPTTMTWGPVTDWGIDAPTTAPVATQKPRPNQFGTWGANQFYRPFVPITGGSQSFYQEAAIVDGLGNLQLVKDEPASTPTKTAATGPPAFATVQGNTAVDGTVTWICGGPSAWKAGWNYQAGSLFVAAIANPPGTPNQMFVAINGGLSGATPPAYTAAIGSQFGDGNGTLIWQNIGPALNWNNIGPSTLILPIDTSQIVDPNGYLEVVYQQGKSGPTPPPVWGTETGSLTADALSLIWQNTGPYSVAGTAPVQYGYAFATVDADGDFIDISNMSPASAGITVIGGNEVTVTGDGCTQTVGKVVVVIYRTPQGGSTFLYLDQIPNPAAGVKWTYIDTKPDSELNTEIQAQVGGEGTPLPAGATCLGYHLTRVFAAVGNVVYISSGPDAIVAGSSGNAGFDTTFTCQSKITRFWACSLGMVVFTVRDAYIILGSATDADPLYMVVFIEDLPLKSYDCFAVNKTTPYMLMGNNQLVALDPSAGILEVGFPIADRLMEEYDPTSSYVTFHSQSSLDTALYVATGNGQWYRMAANNAPEQGSAWSTKAVLAGFNSGCVQSVEVSPGTYRLLISSTAAGPTLQRDRSVSTDNGQKYAVQTIFGSIVLAQPGQLAALSFVTLESVRIGTRAGLALLLGEIAGTFESLSRTRQDPPNLPPSSTLYSDRYHFAQNQQEAWCRHFQMEISWPAEDAANELLTFTIFGQTWQEMRSQ